MPGVSPPYDFPPRRVSDGEKIAVIVQSFKFWLITHPVWVPLFYRIAQRYRA